MILSRIVPTFGGILAIELLLAGCGPSSVTQTKADMTQQAIYHDSSAVVPAHGLRPPATFRGDLPCADCVGVRHHLNLWPDQIFHLRRE